MTQEQDSSKSEQNELTQPEFKPADLNTRMLASAIDMAIIMLLVWPLLIWLLKTFYVPLNPAEVAAALQLLPDFAATKARLLETGIMQRYLVESFIQVFIAGLLIIPFWIKVGATPGKYLFRMRVVDSETLQLLSLPRAILRYACYASCILSLGLGLIWISMNKKKQGLHDLLAGTRVIILPRGYKFN